MPGKVKVKIIAGRNLPVMDRSSDTTDAYVEIKLGNTSYKTDVCRKSLNPQWNSEWYRFEMDDAELQDEPLQIRLMDHDTYSANDAIGKVYIDLNPLLLPSSSSTAKSTLLPDSATASSSSISVGNTMSGWFPVYDTMHGIRGEVNIIVKVELFSDFNKFRQSSCGVQFFNSSVIPQGYHAQVIHGLVEELIVSDDPEYQWIDKIRTPRASNEARQTIFLKLSGEVQRKIGLKVLDLGGNAVIGYKQCFDLEGESGIVVRGLGTAATLIRLYEHAHAPRPTMTTEEISINTNVDFISAGVPPVVSVIPASPSPYHSFLPSARKKSLLVPKSPRPVYANSPNRWQPFSEIRSRSKNLALSSPSLNTDIFDNLSVKSLCEQEDMRGEVTSNRKKLFRAISEFPRKRIKALKSNSADRFSFTKRKRRTYACSTALIKSIIDSKYFLDSVSEREEPIDSNKKDDSGSLYLDDEHSLMRYVGENLESEGSSSSSDSLSSDVDISDISSVNISGTEMAPDFDSEQEKYSNKLSKTESFENSSGSRTKCVVESGKIDSGVEIGTPAMCSDITVDNKNNILPDHEKLANNSYSSIEKAVDSENIDSSLDVHVKSQLTDDENIPKCFSKLVEFKETSSEKAQRNPSLQRQDCFDNSFKGRSRYIRRSDTPPLSEMDPYMKFSLDDNMTYTETIFTPQSVVKVTVTQPSIDNKMKSKSVPNLNQPETNVEPEVNESSSRETVFKTVHTVDFSSVNLLLGSDFPYPVSNNIEASGVKSVMCSDNPSRTSITESHHPVENKQQIEKIKPYRFTKVNVEHTDHIIIPLKDSVPEYENIIQDTSLIQKPKEQFESCGKQKLDHNTHVTHCHFSSLNSDGGDHIIIPLKDPDDDKECFVNESSGLRQKCDSEFKQIFDLSNNSSTLSTHKKTYKQEGSLALLKDPECIQECVTSQTNFAAKQVFNSKCDNKFDDHCISKFNFPKSASEQIVDDLIPLELPENDYLSNLCQKQNSDNITKMDVGSKQEDFHDSDKKPNNCLYQKDNSELKCQDISSDFKFNLSSEFDCNSKPKLIFEPELSPQIPSVVESVNLTSSINNHKNCSGNAEQCFEVVTHSAADSTQPASVANKANLTLPHDPCHVRSYSDSGLIEPRQGSFPPNRSVPEDVTVQQSSGPSASIKTSQSPARATTSTSIHRRSSDSDLSITPKGNSLTGSDRSSIGGAIARPLPSVFLRPSLYKEAFDSLEYPFLTMSKYPPGFILHLGGLIQSRSVKLLERMTNIEEPESRDSWWSELRLEIRSHARALACNIVLGYSEHTAICDDVCVLSASGTAAVVSVRPSEISSLNSSGVAANLSDTPEALAIVTLPKQFSNLTTAIDRPDYERQAQAAQFKQEGSSGSGKQRRHSDSMEAGPETNILPCNPCHLPYNVKKMPYSLDVPKCGVCRKARVPDVMYCTIEPPDNIPVAGQCCLLQAFVCRPKRDCRAELNAKEISDALPFLEYELHSQLLNKLRVSGMNAVFGVKIQICLGEKMIGALATGTAVLLAALPPPPAPVVTPGNAFQNDEKLAEIQKKLQESIKQNRDYYQLRPLFSTNVEGDVCAAVSDTEESEDDLPEPDLTAGNKDACILVIDDAEDADVITRLLDPLPPNGFHVSATESLPGLEDLGVARNLQMFTQIWRSKIPPTMPLSLYNKHFHKLLQGVYFKLRRMVPCAIGNVRFLVEMPEPEELQISLVGMALGLAETERVNRPSRKKLPSLSSSKDMTKKDDPEMIFCLEEDQESSGPVAASAAKPLRPGSPVRSEKKKPKHVPPKEHYGVDITSLSFIPGARIERYVGNLNFFFIRESTSVREGGGLSGFLHSFVAEVLAIVRAHITALGGNAMVAYSMCDCILHNNPHKNNGQCLVNVVGDAVYVSYPQE